MTPSHYQQAIYDFCTSHPLSSAVIEAVAGSGKTTTSVEAMKHLRMGMAIAFNKPIQLHLETVVPPGWSARTFNSLGFESCRVGLRGARLNKSRGKGGKNWTYAQQALPSNYKESISGLARLMGLAKSMGFGPCVEPTQDNFRALLQAHNVDIESSHIDKVLEVAPDAYIRNVNDKSELDFDDQVLYPLLHDLPTLQWDRIIVDESQDMSILQQFLVRDKFLRPGGRIIAFGDTYQSIYAFRGADSSAMQHCRELFSAESLPLSISYRCPTSVCDLARKFCPQIEARPSAPEGAVLFPEHLPHPEQVPFDALIMCRNNAPLMAVGLRFLRAGIPCRMRSNISDQLKRIIRDMKTDDFNIFQDRLKSWYETEREKCEARKLHARGAWLEDMYGSLRIVCDASTSINQMFRYIESVFNKTRGPIVSTIHKAKGLEAPDAYLICPHLIPGKWATKDWEIQQENNLLYVAYTRAMERLHIVG